MRAKDSWLKCPRCGEEAYVKGPDAIDWCDECGIVEGQCIVMNGEDNE